MMKTFCDLCGILISPGDNIARNRLIVPLSDKFPNISVNITKTSGGVDMDFCRYCVMDAINKLDDRKEIENGRD